MIKRVKVQKFVPNVNGINMEKNRQSSFWILKNKAINATVRHLIDDAKDITDLKKRSVFLYVNSTKTFLERISLE